MPPYLVLIFFTHRSLLFSDHCSWHTVEMKPVRSRGSSELKSSSASEALAQFLLASVSSLKKK